MARSPGALGVGSPSASRRSGTPPVARPSPRASADITWAAEGSADQVAAATQAATTVGPSSELACQEQDALLSEGTHRPDGRASGTTPTGLLRQTSWTGDRKAKLITLATIARTREAEATERDHMGRAVQMFEELDEDHNGTLDQAELARLAHKLNHRWSALELAQHFDRLAAMEREHRRSVHDSAGLASGFVPDISAPLSREQVRIAHGRGTASSHHKAPWYVFVPRMHRLGASPAKQHREQLRRDYADMDLKDIKEQAKVWGVDAGKLVELEKLEGGLSDANAKDTVIALISEIHVTKQLFDISFLKPFQKERCPMDRTDQGGGISLTRREVELIWEGYQSRFDPDERRITEIQQPVFLSWWKGYRRRMQREVLGYAKKMFVKHSHIEAEQRPFQSGTIVGRVQKSSMKLMDTVRVMSANEMKSVGKRINKTFDWFERDTGCKFEDKDFQEARELTGSENCRVDKALSFDEFAHYIRKKLGSDEVGNALLPEFMVQQIDDNVPTTDKFGLAATKAHRSVKSILQRQKSYRNMMSARGTLQAARAKYKQYSTDENRRAIATALWAFLKPRLEMLVRFEAVWGSVHDLYPHNFESDYTDVDIVPRHIRHPDSRVSIGWDLLQVIALMYVAALVPLRIGFNYEPQPPSADGLKPLGELGWWSDLVIDLYFITDIFVQFHTAFVDTATGLLITDRKIISQGYIRSWFILDIVSVMPFSYLQLLSDAQPATGQPPLVSSYLAQGLDTDEGTGVELEDNTKILKLLRFLRIAKLLRLTKFKGMMARYDDKFDVSQYVSSTATLVMIGWAAHFLSCLWYAVGTGRSHIDGWVTNSETGLLWEIEDQVTLGTRYIASMHSILNAQWAFTNSEKIFSVFGELVMGLIYGALAGLMSSIMMSTKLAEQEKTLKFQSIKAWMKSRELSRTMQAKIMSHYHNKYKTRAVFDEDQVRCCAMQSLRYQRTRSFNSNQYSTGRLPGVVLFGLHQPCVSSNA